MRTLRNLPEQAVALVCQTCINWSHIFTVTVVDTANKIQSLRDLKVGDAPEPSIFSGDKEKLRKTIWTLMAEEGFREQVGLVDPKLVFLNPGYQILFVPDNAHQRELLDKENFAIEQQVLGCLPHMTGAEQESIRKTINEVMVAKPVLDVKVPGM